MIKNQQEWQEMSPYGQYEEVEVVFPATANTDIEVPHSLKPYTPEHVDYQVVRQNQPSIIYHDGTAERRPWQPGFIILRSNMANAVATLRLSVRHKEVPVVLAPVSIDPTTNVLLDGNVHSDTDATAPVRGDLIVRDAAGKWAPTNVGAAGTFLKSDGTDPAWSADGTSLTGVAKLASDNVFTAGNRLSGTAPALQWNETDQAVGSKNWDFITTGGVLKIRTLDDSYGSAVELLTIARDGTFTNTATVATVHNFNNNVNGANLLGVNNTNASAGAYSGFTMENDQGSLRGLLIVTSNAFGTAGYVADALNLASAGVGGTNIYNSNASGPFKVRTGGSTVRLEITSGGQANFSGALTERGRTTPIGEWIDIAYAAGNFTASAGNWTVDLADQTQLSYTIIGKTCILVFDIANTDVSSTPATLYIALPVTPGVDTRNLCQVIDAGTQNTGFARVAAGDARLQIFKTLAGANYTTTAADNTSVRGQIAFEIQ